MRQGQNPAKSIEYVAQPNKITLALITYIPFPSGYYSQSLEVLKVCLGSIVAHTYQAYDLMVFDNNSCPQVVEYLKQLKDEGKIQYLFLASTNIGKVGAWNILFGAAPGEYIVYSDSDVYFYPGWLSKHIEVFDAFPEAGTVTGLPRRGRRTFYTSTIERFSSLPNAKFEQGKFVPDDWIIDHARSLGKLDKIQDDLNKNDYRIARNGVSAYATATHFQFMVRSEVVRDYLPFPSERPMGDSVAHFDRAINDHQLLRLATTDRVVQHIGNTLDEDFVLSLPPEFRQEVGVKLSPVRDSRSFSRSFLLELKPVKWLLHRIYDWIFRSYYR